MMLVKRILNLISSYFPFRKALGHAGKNSKIQIPCYVTTCKSIYLEDNVVIRRGATILNNINEKITIKKYTIISVNSTIITNNHISTVGIPHCLLGASHVNDISKDIIIGEDVFVGANVTIMPSGNIGRGCVVGACSLVTKSLPPYAVAVGIPAKIVGVKFTIDQILKHEEVLYAPEERMTKKELETLFEKYYINKNVYGKEKDLTENDINHLIWAKKKRNFIEPVHNPIIYKSREKK